MQSKSVKSLIANLFSISGDTFKKPGKSGPGKSAHRYRKAVDYLDNIFEFIGNVLEKTLLYYPQIGCMSDESNSAGKIWKVMSVEVPEESENILIGVKTKDFADDFHCKYFAVSQLRHWPSGSNMSWWKEFFHKIISFTEDIYDKSIKIHFLALDSQWNIFCFLPIYSIGQRAFLISVHN